MNPDIRLYHDRQSETDRQTCDVLFSEISQSLPTATAKIWHGAPVWFIDGNPIVGYHKLKGCIRLLFWSGQGFASPGLTPSGTFKAAEARYASVSQVDTESLRGWLKESPHVQWDYGNIRKNRGLVWLDADKPKYP